MFVWGLGEVDGSQKEVLSMKGTGRSWKAGEPQERIDIV
jgi:hypothetical protein